MKVASSVIAALAALSGTVGTAVASNVVYNGGPPNQLDGNVADGNTGASFEAEVVPLSSEISFNGMNWWGLYAPPLAEGTDSFTLKIYQNVAGNEVGDLVEAVSLGDGSRMLTGNIVGGTYLEYGYSSTFSQVTLRPGSYWFALSNSTTSGEWFWENTSGGPGIDAAFYSSNGAWNYYGEPVPAADWAFDLTDTPIPLPATGWLLLSGLGAIGGVARIRRETV